MSAMPCPAEEALKQFRLGRLSDGPARVVEQHLFGCPACLARMPGLPLNDPIVNSLRGAAGRSRLNNPLLAQVQQKLRAQPFPRPGSPPPVANAPGSPRSTPVANAPGSPGRWLIVGGVAALLLILIVFLALPRKRRIPGGEAAAKETGTEVPVVLDPGFGETWVTRPGPADGVKSWCIESNDVGLVYPTTFHLTNDDLLLHYHFVNPPPPPPPGWWRFDPETLGLTAAPFRGDYTALSPSARTCARSVIGGVQLWDVGHPEPRVTLRSPGPRYSALFSPDGAKILTGNGDGTSLLALWVWDAKEANKLGQGNLPGAAVGFNSPTWSADGKALACAGGSNLFVFREPWKEISRTLSRPQTVSTLAWSPKGDVLATVESDNRVHIVDVEHGKDAMELPALPASTALAWSADGNQLAFATTDRKVVVWDVEKKKIAFTFSGHQRDVGAVAFLRDGRTLISISKGSVRFWDLQEKRLRGTLLHLTGLRWAAISPEGNYRCSADGESRFVFKFRENNNELRDLSPENFRKVFGWKNQPDKVKLTGK